MIINGFAGIFVRVFYQNTELSEMVDRMSYVMDEEDDDLLDITIQTRDRNAADRPEFQEGTELSIIWGFTKGETSEKRKIWIRDIKWNYKTEVIEGILTCTEKGTELKSSTDDRVYKNKTLAHIVKDKADKHGLIAVIEPDEVDVNFKVELKRDALGNPTETLDQILKRETDARIEAEIKRKKAKSPEQKKKEWAEFIEGLKDSPFDKELEEKRQIKEEYQKTYRDSRGNALPISNERVDLIYQTRIRVKNMINAMGILKSSPQANKSDKAYLNDLASREKTGPYIVETRDDKLILKRRNFNAPPYRTYEYGGPTGELLDFTPESKTRTKAGSSSAMGFSGWNPLNKTSFSGVADGDGDSVLTQWTNELKFYEAQEKKYGGDVIVDGKKRMVVNKAINSVGSTSQKYNFDQKNSFNGVRVKDNAFSTNALLRNGIQEYHIRIKDHVRALKAAIQDRTTEKEARIRQMYWGMGINPEEAFNNANALRKNAELNRNPATASVWGDPKITVGMIITFMGVGKKYSGNFYIKRVTHTVDRSSGYITDMELIRQGSNIQTPEAKSQAKGNKTINNLVGPTKSGNHSRKNLKINSNGNNKKG